MRILKRFFGYVLLMMVFGVGVAYLLPREVEISRSITIDAPPVKVFPLVNSLEEGAKWSPWLGRDPKTRLAFSGPHSGVGSRIDWRSDHPNVGSGSQIITNSEFASYVATKIDSGRMGTANAKFDLQPAGTGTLITWNYRTDVGLSPVSRWMGLMMDRWVGGDYEMGLANLKRLAEDS